MKKYMSTVLFRCPAPLLALAAMFAWAAVASATTLTYPVRAADGTIVGQVTVKDGQGITGGFTSTYGDPPSQAAAAEKCGEDHFNWFQIVTSDTDPPTLPDGTKPTPPYVDPPRGGYTYGWADNKPWYWDEGEDPVPPPANFEDGYNVADNQRDTNGDGIPDTLGFTDYPSGTPGTHVEFETYLVSLNADGSLHSFHDGFSWSYNNPGEEASWVMEDGLNRNIFPPAFPGISMIQTPLTGGMAYRWSSLLGLIPGDATLDGMVDADDLAIMAVHWGHVDPLLNAITWREGDFTGDGRVNAADAALLAANWSHGIVPSMEMGSSVPEPGSLVLILGACFWLILGRRR